MSMSEVTWQVSHEDDRGGFRWGKVGREFVAEWVGLLTVRTDPDGRVLSSIVASGADAAAVEKLARGAGRAFAGWVAGRPSLHAGAVAFDREAVAIVGASGAGKSTMIASMCEEPSVEMLADDVLLLDPSGWLAEPTESAIYVAGVHGKTKRPLSPRSIGRRSVPLRAVVDLRFDPEAKLCGWSELHGGDAFSVLAAALLRFEATPPRWIGELDCIVALANHTRVFQLTRPRDLGQVRTLARTVIHQLRGGLR